MAKFRNKFIVSIICIVVVVASCATYQKFSGRSIFKSSTIIEKNIGDYTFTVLPKSSSDLLKINKGIQNEYTNEKYKAILNEYDQYQCYLFEIKIKNYSGDLADYGDGDYDKKINYYLFEMQRDLHLENSKGDEETCLIYYYERLNELTKSYRFLIGFKKTEHKHLTLKYNNPYFTCGKVNINLSQTELF